jgi:addiction module RelE/StbE family toxin
VKVLYSARFKKKLKNLIKSRRELGAEIGEIIQLLLDDPKNLGLRLHKLNDDLGEYWSVAVNDDLRIVFYYLGNTVVLLNIGTHEEVYKMN